MFARGNIRRYLEVGGRFSKVLQRLFLHDGRQVTSFETGELGFKHVEGATNRTGPALLRSGATSPAQKLRGGQDRAGRRVAARDGARRMPREVAGGY